MTVEGLGVGRGEKPQNICVLVNQAKRMGGTEQNQGTKIWEGRPDSVRRNSLAI